jgi:hypothetical protein
MEPGVCVKDAFHCPVRKPDRAERASRYTQKAARMKQKVLDLQLLPRSAKVGTSHVAAHYNKCNRTIFRWLDDPDVGFPKPKIIRGRKHWTVGEILDFDALNPGLAEETGVGS